MQSFMILSSTYGYFIFQLILVFGTAVLFFRNKTVHTEMIFFGLLFSYVTPPLTIFIAMSQSTSLIFILLHQLSLLVSAIGFLLYAKSLPKQSKT